MRKRRQHSAPTPTEKGPSWPLFANTPTFMGINHVQEGCMRFTCRTACRSVRAGRVPLCLGRQSGGTEDFKTFQESIPIHEETGRSWVSPTATWALALDSSEFWASPKHPVLAHPLSDRHLSPCSNADVRFSLQGEPNQDSTRGGWGGRCCWAAMDSIPRGSGLSHVEVACS